MRAWPLGEEVVLGTRAAAARVTTAAGVDVTSLLDGTGEGFAGGPGDTLLVEFAAGEQAAVIGEEQATQGHEPFHIDDGGKCPPDCGSPLQGPAAPLSASAIDAQVPASSGVQLQAPDGQGGWRTVVTRYPREHPDQAVFDGLGHGPVRLVFVGRHRVRFVGRIAPSGAGLTVRALPLEVARHSRLGDVSAALAASGWRCWTRRAAGCGRSPTTRCRRARTRSSGTGGTRRARGPGRASTSTASWRASSGRKGG